MAKEYAPEVKAAVMAALMEGQTIRKAADDHGVSKSTVAAWSKEAEGIIAASVQFVPDTKKERIKELLIDLVIAKIESQIAINQHTHDKEWLMKQDASALAMLLGVGDDKLIRLLEKFGGARTDVGITES
jgi:transposase-like protein